MKVLFPTTDLVMNTQKYKIERILLPIHMITTAAKQCVSKAVHFLHDWSCHSPSMYSNPLNAELNPICHLLALLGGAIIVVISRLRVN